MLCYISVLLKTRAIQASHTFVKWIGFPQNVLLGGSHGHSLSILGGAVFFLLNAFKINGVMLILNNTAIRIK